MLGCFGGMRVPIVQHAGVAPAFITPVTPPRGACEQQPPRPAANGVSTDQLVPPKPPPAATSVSTAQLTPPPPKPPSPPAAASGVSANQPTPPLPKPPPASSGVSVSQPTAPPKPPAAAKPPGLMTRSESVEKRAAPPKPPGLTPSEHAPDERRPVADVARTTKASETTSLGTLRLGPWSQGSARLESQGSTRRVEHSITCAPHACRQLPRFPHRATAGTTTFFLCNRLVSVGAPSAIEPILQISLTPRIVVTDGAQPTGAADDDEGPPTPPEAELDMLAQLMAKSALEGF